MFRNLSYKKILALFCTILLSIFLFSGCAQKQAGLSTDPADYESMVFNNTPWGSSLEEVEKQYGELEALDSSEESPQKQYQCKDKTVFGVPAEIVQFSFFFDGKDYYLMDAAVFYKNITVEQGEVLAAIFEAVKDEELLKKTTADYTDEEYEILCKNVDKFQLSDHFKNREKDPDHKKVKMVLPQYFVQCGVREPDEETGLTTASFSISNFHIYSERAY